MKKNIFPLQEECFYHIFNRGINSQQLFFEQRNYLYFIHLMRQKIQGVATVYAYCLMKNHFHLLVRIRSEQEIREAFPAKSETGVSKIISQQFSNLFNSYTQAINKHYSRTGKLFELPFRRIGITSNEQLVNTLRYIHHNPVKHGIMQNAEDYRHSSWFVIRNGIDDGMLPVEKILALLEL